MGPAIQMADLFFPRSGVLEHGRSRSLRIHDQSAGCSLLHAGPKYNAAAWARSSVWRLWNVGDRAHASLSSRAYPGRGVEGGSAAFFVLVAKRRVDDYVHWKPSPTGSHANLGFRRARLLVRA